MALKGQLNSVFSNFKVVRHPEGWNRWSCDFFSSIAASCPIFSRVLLSETIRLPPTSFWGTFSLFLPPYWSALIHLDQSGAALHCSKFFASTEFCAFVCSKIQKLKSLSSLFPTWSQFPSKISRWTKHSFGILSSLFIVRVSCPSILFQLY